MGNLVSASITLCGSLQTTVDRSCDLVACC
jgi:hypothetical protein